MVIKIRDDTKILRKVMFIGKDGSGKSTAAAKYCKAKHLKPICIDFDETNIGTGVPCMELIYGNHLTAKKAILNAIDDVAKSPDYDTLIFDNVGTMLDDVSASRENDPFMNAATDAFKDIMKKLKKSGLNVIFITQIDFYIDEPGKREEKNNKKAVQLNALVNEKYYCYRSGTTPENYTYHCVADKKREVSAEA